MKTEKQIKLMEEDIAKEYKEKYANIDKIITPIVPDYIEKVKCLINENKNINFFPIIRDGVFVKKAANSTDFLYFHVFDDSNTNNIKFHVSVLYEYKDPVKLRPQRLQELEKIKIENPKKYSDILHYSFDAKPLWLFDCDIMVEIDKFGHYALKYRNFDNAKIRICKKQNRKYTDKRKDTWEACERMHPFILTMGWLNYINENQELKIVESVGSRVQHNTADTININQNSSNGIADSKKSSPIRREILLNGIKVITTSEKLVKKLSSKKRQYLAEAWSVRGHYRHYKFGKVSYVKPYTKGKKGGQKTQKIYVAN